MLKVRKIKGRYCIRVTKLLACLARTNFRGDVQKARVWLNKTLAPGWKREKEVCLQYRGNLYITGDMVRQVLAWRLQEIKKAAGVENERV